MKDEYKTNEQQINELMELRMRIAEIETEPARHMERKRTLKASEEELQRLIDATQETLVLIDREGKVLLANEVVAQRLETSMEELIGSCVYDHFTPDVISTRKEQFDKVFETGEFVCFEDARGGRFFETYCYPVFDKKHKVSRIAIFAHDITAQKQAEKKLLESEERYRVAIEHSNDGVAIMREDRHIYVNRKFLEIFGYDSPDEVIGRALSLVVHPDDLAMVAKHNRGRQRGDLAPSRYEFRGIRKDGRIVYIEISAAGTIYQGIPASLAYFRDVTDRKQAEEALKESEERYRLISENVMDVICLHDPDSRYVYVSPSAETVLGYTPQEALGRSPYDLFEPGERERILAPSHRKVTHDKVSDITVYKTRKKDGSYIWLETKVKPILDPDGALRYILTASRDVTERIQAEEALGNSEEKYRNIFENAVMGIFQTTPDGRFLSANTALARMYGYDSPDEMITDIVDMKNQLYVNPEDRTRFTMLFEDHGSVEGFETELYHRDGSRLWISMNARAVLSEDGAVLCYEGTAEDITKRKQAEEKYRSIFENAVMGIFQTSPEGRYLSINPAGARMYGYDSPGDMKQSVTDIAQQIYVRPEDRKRFKEIMAIKDSLEGFEAEHYRKDGSKIWTSMNARAVRDASGMILYYETTAENITDRKHLQAQLLQSQKMEAIGTLAGGVAHDFNNILMAVIGYSNLLQAKMEMDDPLRLYVDQILASSLKAANLTQSLLAFSRKQVIELKPLKVSTILNGIEKLLRRLLPEDIELKIDSLAPDTTIMADISQMDQVLLNLATNAKDSMPKGGTFSLATKEVKLGNEFKKVHGFGEPGKYAVISATDTGIGMDEKVKAKIFEPFFTTKEVGKGTGLGLSIVYGVVKQHNGYITVMSRVGRGTTFQIYLPKTNVMPKEATDVPVSTRGGTETILLAEDNADLRGLMREVLISEGYTVIEAVDGEDCVQRFMEQKDVIALLILDVVMPKKDGKEAYEAIRKVKPDIRTIFASGYTGDVVFDKGVRDGAFDFISKPVRPDELLAKVRSVLDR